MIINAAFEINIQLTKEKPVDIVDPTKQGFSSKSWRSFMWYDVHFGRIKSILQIFWGVSSEKWKEQDAKDTYYEINDNCIVDADHVFIDWLAVGVHIFQPCKLFFYKQSDLFFNITIY